MQDTKKRKIHKLFGLFSAMRLYNIALLVLAQYFTAIFVFSVGKSLVGILSNIHLHLVVFSTICVVSAGYLINDFYDVSIDVINKPFKTHINNWVSKSTKLKIYFVLNFMGFALAFLVSINAVVFFSFYIFMIWLYSHKLQKQPITKLFSMAVLEILPFFIVFVYYKHISMMIIAHGFFLFGLLLIKEVLKDFTSIRGALLIQRETLLTKYGAKKVKTISFVIITLLLINAFYITRFDEVGKMKYYFLFFMISTIPISVFFLKARQQKQYYFLHNILKILLVLGVFSLMWVDTNVILNKVLKTIHL